MIMTAVESLLALVGQRQRERKKSFDDNEEEKMEKREEEKNAGQRDEMYVRGRTHAYTPSQTADNLQWSYIHFLLSFFSSSPSNPSIKYKRIGKKTTAGKKLFLLLLLLARSFFFSLSSMKNNLEMIHLILSSFLIRCLVNFLPASTMSSRICLRSISHISCLVLFCSLSYSIHDNKKHGDHQSTPSDDK